MYCTGICGVCIYKSIHHRFSVGEHGNVFGKCKKKHFSFSVFEVNDRSGLGLCRAQWLQGLMVLVPSQVLIIDLVPLCGWDVTHLIFSVLILC